MINIYQPLLTISATNNGRESRVDHGRGCNPPWRSTESMAKFLLRFGQSRLCRGTASEASIDGSADDEFDGGWWCLVSVGIPWWLVLVGCWYWLIHVYWWYWFISWELLLLDSNEEPTSKQYNQPWLSTTNNQQPIGRTGCRGWQIHNDHSNGFWSAESWGLLDEISWSIAMVIVVFVKASAFFIVMVHN